MRTPVLFVVSLPLLALNNAVTVYEAAGSAQTNRVVSVSRLFAEGEIASCAAAYVSGSPLTTQTDVKSRWADSSLKHAVVSFQLPSLAANGSVVVDFRNTANCNNSSYRTYTEVASSISWGAQLEVTSNSITHTRNAKTMLAACGSISTDPFSSGCRYWLRGPLVTQVIIEDRTTSRAQDFGYQWNGSAWVTAPSDTYKSLHPVFVATIYTPSSGGPFVHVQTILENAWTDRLQRQVYTFRIKTGAGLSTVYTRATNWNHFANLRWRIDRWSGSAPADVFVDHNLEYMSYSKAIPQYADSQLAATAGDGMLTMYNATVGSEEPALCAMVSYAGNGSCANWRTYMPQGGGRPDLALTPRWYAIHLTAMGNPSFPVAGRVAVRDKLLLGNALAGGRVYNAYREAKTDRCLHSGATEFASSAGCAANAFGFPVSIEARPTAKTDQLDYYYSSAGDKLTSLCSSGACQAWPDFNMDFVLDSQHNPDLAYIPYLLTGDWYHLQTVQFWASWQIGTPNPGNEWYRRHGNWGMLYHDGNNRWWPYREVMNAAWISPDADPAKEYYRRILENNLAIFEGEYNITNGNYYDPATNSRWYWGRNIRANNSGTANPFGFDPSTNTGLLGDEGINRAVAAAGDRRFYYHQRWLLFSIIGEWFSEARPVANHIMSGLVSLVLDSPRLGYTQAMYHYPTKLAGSPPRWPTSAAQVESMINFDCTLSANITSTTATTFACTLPDTQGYLMVGVPGYELGNSPTNVFQIGNEKIRVTSWTWTQGGGLWTHNFTGVTRGYAGTTASTHTAGAAVTRVFVNFPTLPDLEYGYQAMFRASLAKAVDNAVPRARAAWEWFQQNRGDPSFSANPQWAFSPRHRIESVAVTAGAGGAIVRFSAPNSTIACSGVVGSSPPGSSLDDADTPIPAGSLVREWVVSALAANTVHYGRLTCGAARVSFSFATISSGLPVSYSKRLGGGPPGSDNMLIEVSPNSDMSNSSTTVVACSSGCSASLPGLTAGAIYYERHSWRTASGVPISRSKIEPFVAK